jgi:hypothetical protein
MLFYDLFRREMAEEMDQMREQVMSFANAHKSLSHSNVSSPDQQNVAVKNSANIE